MEGAKRWGYASETTVRRKREPTCPKPHAPVCCPSSVPSLRQPRNPCLQQGSQPVRAGVNLAVAPQGPCPPWPSHDRVGSRMTKRLPPWLDAPGSGGWRAPQPRQTCRSSPPCGTIPWDLSSGCRSESGRRRRLEQQRDQGGSASAWMPPNGPSPVQPRRPNHESMPGGNQQPTRPKTVRALPHKLRVLLGRTLRGPQPADLRCNQAWPPALAGGTALQVRGVLGSRGRPSDYRGERIDLPTQKPRTRHKHPHPHWSEAPQAAHTALRPVRLLIAHAMGGRQRSTIVGQVCRKRQADCEDDAVGICAGLWNFALSY